MTQTPLDKALAAAQAVHTRYGQQVEAIRKDPALSEHGRRQRITEAHVEAKDRLTAIRLELDEERARRTQTLERSLFGHRGDPVGFRDATERAERATNAAEARSLLERAGRTGDDQLARAIAMVAVERGWRPTVDMYVDGVSDDERRDFLEYAGAKGATTDGRRQRIVESMQMGLSRPPEYDPALARELGVSA